MKRFWGVVSLVLALVGGEYLLTSSASAQPVTHSNLTGLNLHQPFHFEQEADPGAVGAGKWWYKPSTNTIFRRNSSNNAWDGVTVPTNQNLTEIAALLNGLDTECLGWSGGVIVSKACGGGGGGSDVVLDLADDGANESIGITEIATTGDTTGVFTEPSADKLLIDLSKEWPGSSVHTNGTSVHGATSANTASRIVMRDASGNFTAGTITATLSGNATNVSGTVAVANGGTGATTASGARTNLGAQTSHANLNGIAGLTFANNKIVSHDGVGFILIDLPDCDDTGGQHYNYDVTTRAFSCGTSGGTGISGLTANKIPKATSATAIGDSILQEVGGTQIKVNGDFQVGECSPGCVNPDISALTANRDFYVPDTATNTLVVGTTATAQKYLTHITDQGVQTKAGVDRAVQFEVFAPADDVTTGDGKVYFRIPAILNGMNLVTVSASVITAGTTNATNVDLARCAAAATGNVCSGTVVDMLSTNLTIDSGENDSATAAAAAVIDTANDDVATGQIIRVDVDAVSTTAPKGLIVNLEFQLP